jgi:hypothetical protein
MRNRGAVTVKRANGAVVLGALLWRTPADAGQSGEAPTGIEPVASSGHALEPNLLAWVERQAAEAVRLYLPRFNVGDAL